MSANEVNASVILLCPLTGQHPEWFPKFREVYLQDDNHPEFDGKLQIKCRCGGDYKSDFKNHIEIVKNHPEFFDLREEPETDSIVFAFNISDTFKDDLEKLKKRKFVDTTRPYKELCRRVFRGYVNILEAYDKIFEEESTEMVDLKEVVEKGA